MKQQVSPRSKKEEIWQEKERLEEEAKEQKRRLAILEKEVEGLKKELDRSKERSVFAEKLKDDLRASSEKLGILATLTRDLASFDQDGVLKTCVERIPYLVGARTASLYLFDPVKKLLTLKQHTHDRPIDPIVDVEKAPGSLMAQAIRTRSLLFVSDLTQFKREDGSSPARPHQDRYKTRSCIVAPLVAGGEALGVLNLADRFDEKPFDPNADLDLVRQAADVLAVSLRNARLFDEVQSASRTDSLTGLFNHRALVERLDIESKRAKRYGHDLALVLVDVDGFALLNANHGHQAGDAVLEQSAKLVRGNVRDVDIVGRTGGDEFAVVLPEQNLKGALVVGERLARIFKDQRFRVGDKIVEASATIGIVHLTTGESASEALVRAKDAVLGARREKQSVGIKS
ncbi:MAG: GGDEF domain-containing protein [Planctomycetota bacterium]